MYICKRPVLLHVASLSEFRQRTRSDIIHESSATRGFLQDPVDRIVWTYNVENLSRRSYIRHEHDLSR